LATPSWMQSTRFLTDGSPTRCGRRRDPQFEGQIKAKLGNVGSCYR
jgi:hypothetical protein